jgi:hypothetical protein
MNQEKLNEVREAHKKQLEDNGHVITNNVLESDTASLYCGVCGHSFAIVFDSETEFELLGKDFEAPCVVPEYQTENDNG